jgi:chemotaxis protein CheX
VHLTPDAVFRIAESVWSMILNLPLRRSAEPRRASERTLCASVQIDGAWQGVVNLHCSAVVADQAAMTMFGLVGQAPAPEQVQDALGELANMVGGNVKALLGEGCRLSLPTVVDGIDYSVRVPGRTDEVVRVPMACGDEPVLVSVLRKRP